MVEDPRKSAQKEHVHSLSFNQPSLLISSNLLPSITSSHLRNQLGRSLLPFSNNQRCSAINLLSILSSCRSLRRSYFRLAALRLQLSIDLTLVTSRYRTPSRSILVQVQGTSTASRSVGYTPLLESVGESLLRLASWTRLNPRWAWCIKIICCGKRSNSARLKCSLVTHLFYIGSHRYNRQPPSKIIACKS